MIYSFANNELDISHYELRRDGAPLRIEPKAFDLLAHLIQHHGQVLSKDDLLEHLWPNQFVSESALSYYIATARKAIGDNGRDQRMIKTVYSRGYSFIAPVKEQAEEEVQRPTPESLAPPLPSPQSSREASDAPPVSILPARGRRQFTVMWCSLVIASTTSSHLDPEDRHEGFQIAQEACVNVIQQFGGHIAQYLSHGLFVYFGYPQAREEDAHRAVRAGLALVQTVEQLQQNGGATPELTFAIRVGLNTGIVVIGSDNPNEGPTPLVLGDVPHLAAQMSRLAPPNTVVLSPATAQLVEGYFICQPLGEFFIEELAESITLHHAISESSAHSRIEAAMATRLTPFVGRERENGLLQERWEQTIIGRGQVVLLSGDAGIGKSRLVHSLYEHLETTPYTRIEYRCSPYAQHTAFYPVIEYLQHRLQLGWGESEEIYLEKLHALLEPFGLAEEETVLRLAHLMSSTPFNAAQMARQPHPQQAPFTLLLSWLLGEAERQAVCFVVEDLHWADSATLELISLLIDHIPTSRMLVLLTYRSEFSPPWDIRSYIAPLALNRLPDPQIEQMTLQVTQGKALPAEVLQQLIIKTDGVPLFVEEMTRMILESGLVKEVEGQYELTAPLQPLTIPSTLNDSLMARLDRLEIGKQTVQLAAAIGREFSYELIQAASTIDETVLQQELTQLVDAELLYQRGLFPNVHYLFKHALIQEAAYQSLLRSTRKRYHENIAQTLETQFPATRETQPELLAYHYGEAGLSDQALTYWQQGAEQAIEQSAYVDAIAHIQRGLNTLSTLTDSPERAQRELTLQIMLGATLAITKGDATPELNQIYDRARILCQQVDDPIQLFDTTRGLWNRHLSRLDLGTARELGEYLLELAQNQNDSHRSMEAHRYIATSLFFLGNQPAAADHLQHGLTYVQSDPASQSFMQYGYNPETRLLSYWAWNRWLQGFPEQALQIMDQVLQVNPQQAHSYSQRFNAFIAAVLYQWCGQPDLITPQVETILASEDKHEARFLIIRALPLKSWALAQHDPEAGITQLRQNIATYRSTGSELFTPYLIALLAELYGQTGEIDAGLQILAEALNLVHLYDLGWWEAELHRLQAELLLKQVEPDVAQAETTFLKALDVARNQQAKSLELRAATSLSRLWHQEGKSTQARELLHDLYGWFTEGHETADLQDAKALLEIVS